MIMMMMMWLMLQCSCGCDDNDDDDVVDVAVQGDPAGGGRSVRNCTAGRQGQ